MPSERKAILRAQPTAPQARFHNDGARFRAFTGGVGAGKTYAGVIEAIRQPAGSVGAIIAPTFTMLRDSTLKTFVQIAHPLIDTFSRSELRMKLVDGKEIMFRSADDPDRLRGPNLGWIWLDEAAMMAEEVWDISIGRLRLDPGRGWITTTPRGHNWVYKTFGREDREDYRLIKSSTRDNTHLPGHFVHNLQSKYTAAFARQEIEGEFVVMEGALWSYEVIERNRVESHPTLNRIVIGVDPAGGGPDEVGIIATGIDAAGQAYVIEDASMKGTPNAWATRVAQLYDKHSADRVVAEKNYGGDMVESTLRTAAPDLPVKMVTAARGKALRAEPIAALYEQNKVHHLGELPKLEEQMTTWDPSDNRSKSPDRVDALVFALSEVTQRSHTVPITFDRV